MELKKITEEDLYGVGVVGMEDTPNLSARQMQEKMEEVVRRVVIPAMNYNADITVTRRELARTVFKSGSGDMLAGYYDTDLDGTVNRADNGMFIYTQTGSVLSGSGANGKFKATAGGTHTFFTIDGEEYAVKCGSESEIELTAGVWYAFVLDGEDRTVNFSRGGGLTGSKLALATATPDDVAASKTFYAAGKELKTGTAKKGICGTFQSSQSENVNVHLGFNPEKIILIFLLNGNTNTTLLWESTNPEKYKVWYGSYSGTELDNSVSSVTGYITATESGFDFRGYYASSGDRQIRYMAVG